MDWQGVVIGALATLVSSIAINFVSHWLTRLRAKEDRKELFRLKVYELRLQAAQKAFQYVLKVNRARSKLNEVNITHEAREWLDGQALILGDEIYQKVFYYLNSLRSPDEGEALIAAQKSLKSVIKKGLISL